MTKRLAIFLVALFALGFAVAGCGDDEEDTGGGGGEAAQTETQTEKSGGSGGGGKVDTSDPAVKAAIDQCKKQADANTQLSSEAKDKVGEVCEEAASGDADAAIKATEEACKIIVEDTSPAGPARDTALQACEQAGNTP